MFGTRSIINTLSSKWPKGLLVCISNSSSRCISFLSTFSLFLLSHIFLKSPTRKGRVPLHLMVLRHLREKGLHISFLSSLLKLNDAYDFFSFSFLLSFELFFPFFLILLCSSASKVLDRTGNSPLSLACSLVCILSDINFLFLLIYICLLFYIFFIFFNSHF